MERLAAIQLLRQWLGSSMGMILDFLKIEKESIEDSDVYLEESRLWLLSLYGSLCMEKGNQYVENVYG